MKIITFQVLLGHDKVIFKSVSKNSPFLNAIHSS